VSHHQPSTAPRRSSRRKSQWPLIALVGALVTAAILVSMTFTSHDPTRNELGAPIVPVTQAPTTLVPVPASPPPVVEVPGDCDPKCTYVVGKDIQVGTYRTAGVVSSASANCYFMRIRRDVGSAGIAEKTVIKGSDNTMTVRDGDTRVITANCLPWKRVG
jgi:hypothetical protein